MFEKLKFWFFVVFKGKNRKFVLEVLFAITNYYTPLIEDTSSVIRYFTMSYLEK